eukprot:111162_1
MVNYFCNSNVRQNKLAKYLGEFVAITFKSYSATKFIAHLENTLVSIIRNYCGIIYLFNENLNDKNEEGRKHIYLKNILVSSDLNFGMRFIVDIYGKFVGISKSVQSDLVPLF